MLRKTRKIKIWLAVICAVLAVSVCVPACVVRATEPSTASENTEEGTEEPGPVEIHTYEDLLLIAKNPGGNYVLKEDIDLWGKTWAPVDFTGIFDGDGHSLLNLKITDVSVGREDTFDGNRKQYETAFAGFFGTLKGASVRNLFLVNVDVNVTSDIPCFIGAIAGYSENAAINGCSVQGRLELTAHEKMFGVGGLVGYGNGTLKDCSADVTLICTDTDAATKDEQFMGGAYATGFLDMDGCEIKIDGYISEHGYVHSGGGIGMYMIHPKNLNFKGTLANNKITGKITFFEDNKDRRAYCKGLIGETMSSYTNKKNVVEFERNEIKDYSADLKPDMCEDAEYEETVTEPGCAAFGYTTVTCKKCGYAYTDHYTLTRHSVKEWEITTAPTTESTGIQTGVCELCQTVLQEEVPKLDPVPETESESPEAPSESDSSDSDDALAKTDTPVIFLIVLIVLLTGALVVVLVLLVKKGNLIRR